MLEHPKHPPAHATARGPYQRVCHGLATLLDSMRELMLAMCYSPKVCVNKSVTNCTLTFRPLLHAITLQCNAAKSHCGAEDFGIAGLCVVEENLVTDE